MKIEEKDGEQSRAAIAPLAAAVYPPDIMKTVVWRNIDSAPANRRVVVYDGSILVSSVGIIFRDGSIDGTPVRIGGIGGVMTLPTARRKGYGRTAMLTSHEIISRVPTCAFGLLFCEPKNFNFYESPGWSQFRGTVIAEQQGSSEPYEMMQPMVRQVAKIAPANGRIDLQGLPW